MNSDLPPPSLPPPSLPAVPPPGIPPPDAARTTNQAPAPVTSVGIPPAAGRKKAKPPALEDSAAALDDDQPLAEWLVAAVRDCVIYPWRKSGWAIMIPGAIFSVILSLAAFAPVLGFLPMVLLMGYAAAYFFDIVGTTIGGKSELPEWPGAQNFIEDIVRPALQLIALSLISFLPSLLWDFLRPASAPPGMLQDILSLAGCVYHPMACIAVVLTGSINSALPHRVVPAIIRAAPAYFVTVVTLLLVAKLGQALNAALLKTLPLLFGYLISAVTALCLLIVHARLVGLIGRRHREAIALG